MKFKDYITETKLILKAKVLDMKDFIEGTYKTNSDGSIEVTGSVNISHLNLKKIPWNIVKISGYLSCDDNQLQSLGNLKYVGGDLWCGDNPLESLGNLEYVGKDLWCDDNQLQSLGNLKHVGGELLCHGNKLETLGNLKHVGRDLSCSYNKLQSLGNLKHVGGNLGCKNNTKKFTEKQIRKTIDVKGGIYV